MNAHSQSECDVTGRPGYLAEILAVQAFISMNAGRLIKLQGEVHTKLQRLTRRDHKFNTRSRTVWSINYGHDSIGDDATDADAAGNGHRRQ